MKRFKTLIFIILLTLVLLPVKVFAADEVSFEATGATVKQGQSFTLSVKEKGASATSTLHSYSVTIKFDGNIVRYDGGTSPNRSNISQNGNEITISLSSQVSGDTDIASLNFTALKAGNSSIAVSNTCSINGEPGTCKSIAGNVKVDALGTDAKLSGLSIPNATLTPAFNKNTYEYTTDLKDVKSVEVKATAADPNAKIQISDNYKNLQKGENNISIVVTSEDGSKKLTYKIKVNLELTPTEEELKLANTKLSSLEIKDQKIEFNPEEVKYYLDVPYDVTSLEITAKPENENATIQISGADKLIVGKNTVNILVTAEDGTTTKTYSIMVTRKEAKKKIIQTCPDTTSVKEWIIFSAGLLLTFTLGIVLGYVLCKKGIIQRIFKKKEKQDEAVEIQTLSDTIDLSDVVEEIKDEEDVKKA